jgi:two-component system sensor histidine kinase BaeS
VKHTSLAVEVFVLILALALLTAMLTGLVAHKSLVTVVHTALSGVPDLSGSRASVLLHEAEKETVRNYEAGLYVIAVFVAAAATLVALVVTVRLILPMRRLRETVEGFTKHGLDVRASVEGPDEIASLSRAFNQMADALEEEDHLRRKLVADISHELRNPIAVASAQTEAMLEGVLPADTENLIALLADLQYLGTLMEDLQELGIAESGRWRYQMELFDISALLVRNAQRAGQWVWPGVEIRVVGTDEDELRLSQVLRNILGNAKRYTTSGSITLSLGVAPGVATVRVADTGEGISPEDLPHIFDRFFRADVARSNDTGGAGLGLSIARSIVHDHGGEVFAESEVGRGTVIGFTLPRDNNAATRRVTKTEPLRS